MTLMSSLAKLIVSSSLLPVTHEAAREGLLDFLAVTLPVSRGDFPDAGLNSLHQVYRIDDPLTRALLLGYVGHALDFDDFHPDFRDYPSVMILSAPLVLASQRSDIDDAYLLDAYVTGVEMFGRLGLVVDSQCYIFGLHNTTTLDTIAVVATCARLIHAMERQTVAILGIAATQSASLCARFGNNAELLYTGLAAQITVTAIRLTLAGSHGQPDDVLDSFLSIYYAGQQQPEKFVSDWGAPWWIISSDLESKPYPTYGGMYSTADVARALHQERLQVDNNTDVLIAAIGRAEVSFPSGSDTVASVRKPNTGAEARFSLEHVTAVCLLCGELRLGDSSLTPVTTDIAALAESVAYCPDLSIPPDELSPVARSRQVMVFSRDGSASQQRFMQQQSLAISLGLLAGPRACLPDFVDTRRTELVAPSKLENRDSPLRLVDMLFAKQTNATPL